ncbi:karyopherin/importin beta family nuclear export signal receptor Kap109 [Schizosaccharomyces osmophilus]|uniref:Karyopherin/importin beta family nuclear export signal receptor Kap109 n=1 Tax=Schizosaccharomyces osmophilus TaxID=2545709 RepID=A0AAF0AWD3_9SCHI|nr:karyopherin/importin beta family nuclear export signal receptor Kap109 [Schizosaccharomyces osmophilus]WBW72905.1 karyopherin/importin beta family nuclear export signal receptor Kap109 [Schizosaccharomyces osmophilus]
MDGIPALLAGTLNPATSRSAEEALKSWEVQDGSFALQLLSIVADENSDPSIKLAASLYFKNYIKRYWDAEEDATVRINDEVAELVKREIINLMIKSPANIQVQLGEVVGYIANFDFPDRWDSLLPDLISRLSPVDLNVNISVLSTAHAIFKRWRPLFRSDALFLEIKYVLDRFCEPFLALFKQTNALLASGPQNVASLNTLFQVILLQCKLFYDLNCQDIPEFFEDHITEFMTTFLNYFIYSNPALEDDDNNVLIKVKASICEIAELYTLRYEEVFTNLTDFVNMTWTLLTNLTQEEKYDVLVGKAMAFLTSVIRIRRHAEFFRQEPILQQFIELVILPNICLRESDEELFEDDPLEYVRRDLEGSNSDSRSRSAIVLVRGLLDHFDQLITTVITTHINASLQQSSLNPTSDWNKKYAALQLFAAIAIKGQSSRLGVTSTNLMVDVVSFFESNIRPDLIQPVGSVHPMVLAEDIKFIFTFRNQLQSQQLVDILPIIADFLKLPNFVVYTYASIAIDLLLTLRHDHVHIFTSLLIEPIIHPVLGQLFFIIESGVTPQKLAENDYLMKAIMRIIIMSQERIVPFAELALTHLTKITTEVCKNPSNPKFNHYLFEALGAFIRSLSKTGPQTVSQLESALLPVFQNVLIMDVTEFVPYVLQLLSQLIEASGSEPLPDFVVNMIQPCLSPALWDSKGNIPALVRLLQAMITRGPQIFISNNFVEPVLGIYRKLISSKINDHFGFDLLDRVFSVFDANILAPYINHIFFLLLSRLKNSRTERFSLRCTVFFFFLAASTTGSCGPDNLIHGVDSVQTGVFGQVMSSIILPQTQKLSLPLDRKITAIGMVRLLTSDLLVSNNSPYERLFIPILSSLLKLFELPIEQTQTEADEDLMVDEIDADSVMFQASFSRLATSGGKRVDPFAQIADLKHYAATEMNAANKRYANRVSQIISMHLPGDGQSVLQSYGYVI